jgi:hypothetical protein
MSTPFASALDRAALTLVFALAAIPVIGLPLLAVAAGGVIH